MVHNNNEFNNTLNPNNCPTTTTIKNNLCEGEEKSGEIYF